MKALETLRPLPVLTGRVFCPSFSVAVSGTFTGCCAIRFVAPSPHRPLVTHGCCTGRPLFYKNRSDPGRPFSLGSCNTVLPGAVPAQVCMPPVGQLTQPVGRRSNDVA
ncbi:hypothetical protein BaRGS_00014419 [Batillaria attramentaria]|uniref:Secreted protein n=1 Tax=Batillaria attramentaria TaxID=370345 RepID=A0ABD0L4Z7_9CAEN